MKNNYHYNPTLKAFARHHRNGSTKAEIRLWCELLRQNQMAGYRFLRQRPVSGYIVDFFCKELSLIIEVDGFSHDFPDAEIYDCERQKSLEAMGFTVLRFSDQAVMERLPEVAESIFGWIMAYEDWYGSALNKRSRRKQEEGKG